MQKINNDIYVQSINKFDAQTILFVKELYRTTRWQEVLQIPWTDSQRLDFLDQQFNAQHVHYQNHYPQADFSLILYQQEKVGRVYLDTQENLLCLIDIALLPNFQKKGIGSKILQNILEKAQSDDKKVTIHVESFNPAYKWYLAYGFQQIEDRGVYQYMEWYPK